MQPTRSCRPAGVEEVAATTATSSFVYDRVLETFTPSAHAYRVNYGLDEVDARESTPFASLMTMPARELPEQLARDAHP